ncbi:hypothetical protein NQ317_008341 [Molorchus minor]|uniref:LKB1 serine/threonine kinase interacting protein 1 N-terminal domain-containing protein n=1 Tax=Molorchus minor TaxID=1323400 RepID=A0ABQ9IXG6_9CUCU|nr:hypothetical protein NQ317_008341 [Molorchus minor]
MDISQVAAFLRPVCKDVFNGKGILCLSTNYLKKFNDAFETNINEDFNKSFHMVQTSNAKANLMRDLQFLLDLVQRTIHLKVIPDVNDDPGELQDITCSHSVACLSDVLDKCGSDGSQRYSWNDLKRANFSHNGIVELDDSLESTHLLHTLNLSHNQLSTVNFVNLLPNLKCLNLSYNKIITVPHFKGHICKRLQATFLNGPQSYSKRKVVNVKLRTHSFIQIIKVLDCDQSEQGI